MGAVVKRKMALFTGVILNMVLLSGCGEFLDTPVGTDVSADGGTAVTEAVGKYEITDRDRNTSESGALEIDLENPENAREDIYTFEGRELRIHTGGEYVIKGRLNNGSLVVDTFEDEAVHLILDNAEIHSSRGAAIYVEQASKVILTAREGTVNVLSDGVKYEEVQKACVFSNSDLTINGSGLLEVYAYYADGVRSKDQVKAVNADLYVKAKGDGIRGNDGVILSESTVEVECEGTGIFSGSDKDMVIIEGGSCKVIAGKNAISVSRYVSIRGSRTDLYSVWEAISCDGIREIEEEVE